MVAQLAVLGVDETLTARVQVDAAAGTGPEAAAREARYAVLEQVAEHLGARRGAARAHPGRPGRDGAARPGPRLGRALAAGHAARLRRSSCAHCSAYAVTTPSPPARSRASTPGTTRTTTTRPTPGSACASGCCRCSRPSSAPASLPRWRARPTSCATTSPCSTVSPARRWRACAATTASTWRPSSPSRRRSATGSSTGPPSTQALRPPSSPATTSCPSTRCSPTGGAEGIDLPGRCARCRGLGRACPAAWDAPRRMIRSAGVIAGTAAVP